MAVEFILVNVIKYTWKTNDPLIGKLNEVEEHLIPTVPQKFPIIIFLLSIALRRVSKPMIC